MRVEVDARHGSKRQPVAYCPEIHDVVLSKLVAGRDRDVDYAREAKAHGLVDVDVMRDRVVDLPIGEAEQARVAGLVATL